ncbi:MAG TPA: family 10 glycosylhydrolase [Bacteroidota bacterium]|nr:family 10 glycosylhydrolase [Bacteroidota bacterium]
MRAVWITTVSGLDWPKSTDRAEQQKSLREMIEKLHRAHFNTIFFQVRGRADALYRSRYEPWSVQLTGTLGADPGWDPLDTAITIAHALGMEVHAWFNTFLVRSGPRPAPSVPLHMVLAHPEWVQPVDDEYWCDPGIPAARQYTLNVAMDLIQHYDVDGIHFDYLRYPQKLLQDDATYRRYGGGMQRDTWRRENINKFLRDFRDAALPLKPMLKIGAAPIGVYLNIGKMRGLQSYSDVDQDSRKWLQDRLVDYLAPQIYWSLGDKPANPDFVTVARDWALNSYNRQIYFGIGAYKPEVFDEIATLVDTSRAIGGEGISFFRYASIEKDLDVGGRFRFLSLIPPMAWKDHIPPDPPRDVHVANVEDGVFSISWQQPVSAPDGDQAKRFNIYRSRFPKIDLNNPEKLVANVSGGTSTLTDTIANVASLKYYYAVTALDKGNNESSPAVEGVEIPELAGLVRSLMPANRLGLAYPSPASSMVSIPYELRESAAVVLKIVDDQSREVVTVVDAVQKPGRYVASANTGRLKSGRYTYRLVAGEFSDRKPLVIRN